MCLIYRRDNVTAQYLSLEKARLAGCWETTPSSQHDNPQCATDVVAMMERTRESSRFFTSVARSWFHAAEDACTKSGRQILKLRSEDYLSSRRATPALANLLVLQRKTMLAAFTHK